MAATSLTLWLSVATTGCRSTQDAARVPGDSAQAVRPNSSKAITIDPAELQQQLLRFADQYLAQLLAAVETLEAEDPQMTRAMVQRIRIGYAGDVWMAASGPNTYADLLDLVTTISLSRVVIEEHWIPEVFGDSAVPLLEVVSAAEKEIWTIAARALNADQQAELRQAIRVWREENPEAVNAMYVRAVGLTERVAEANPRDEDRPKSVFRLLRIDPLAGLDPATRELAQTRIAAERALYIAQRLPFMLRWQGELWSVKVAEMPETKQLLTNTAQLTDAVAQLGSIAEQLPDRFTKEGQRMIEALQSEQQNLLELSTEMRLTLHAGSQMASNTLLTLNCFDEVMQRLQQYNLDSDGELFHIRNYTEAAAQLDGAALHLSGLLNELDETLASTNLHGLVNEVAPVVENVESSGRDLVDYAFKMLLLLLVITCALFLVTAALHRRFAGGSGGSSRK